VLSESEQQGERIAATFWRGRVLRGTQASRSALRQYLPGTSVLHLGCPAWFDAGQPLSVRIDLPSGETWPATEWRDEPLDGLPLVTLSACRSTEPAALAGQEALAPVAGLLGSGVRSVLTGLWPVADREALPLTERFYRERMTADPCTALARAQREALRQDDNSLLFWASFALFGDPDALPGPPRWLGWLARRRQARHARRYPAANPSSVKGA
jgi:CHAT domain-containing protein